MRCFIFTIMLAFFLLSSAFSIVFPNAADSSNASSVWQPDNGDGTYKNPIIYADYSDPDVIHIGGDFYMTSSSFNCVPGLPILHSKDLVNWKLICHALKQLKPVEVFNKPQHGNGVWAPSIRYHNNEFYIYYSDPDYGIYFVTSKHPEGSWNDPVLVKKAKGWIDPCPLWDDDGKVYLIHAFARSRAGIKSVLCLHRMNSEGTKLLDEGKIVFDGSEKHPTIEGPKLYKKNGYYYIFAPAGGVKEGWQTVLRSKNIFGPYEDKIVMDKGKTEVNGPHQGAWVELDSGKSWFIHFQDKGAYGRIVHLQPMTWNNGWPIIGIDGDENGKGEPVSHYIKPIMYNDDYHTVTQTTDEFDSDSVGLQWQWHANPDKNWARSMKDSSCIRLNCVLLPTQFKNYWDVPNLLLQKFPAPEFTVSSKVKYNFLNGGEKGGLIVMGLDYSYLSVGRYGNKIFISQSTCRDADKGSQEIQSELLPVDGNAIFLRVTVAPNAECTFSFSRDGSKYQSIGTKFIAKQGKWIGAKVGLFCSGNEKCQNNGYADFDWFRIEKLKH
jgi:beta-xylosidase